MTKPDFILFLGNILGGKRTGGFRSPESDQ